MRSLAELSSSSSTSSGKEPEIQFFWQSEVEGILNGLESDAKKCAKAFGENPKSGYGFIQQNLARARDAKTIQDVIIPLITIQAAVDARISAFTRHALDADSKKPAGSKKPATQVRVPDDREAFIQKLQTDIKTLEALQQRVSEDEKKSSSISEQQLLSLRTTIDANTRELEARGNQIDSLSREKTELSREKEEILHTKASLEEKEKSLISEKSKLEGRLEEKQEQEIKMCTMLAEEKEEKKKLEERNKALEHEAANWQQLRQFALGFSSQQTEASALVPFGDQHLLSLCMSLLAEKQERQSRQHTSSSEKTLGAQPYAQYKTMKIDKKEVHTYEIDGMQSMLMYSKPPLIFHVIKNLLNKLPTLNSQLRDSTASSMSSSSTLFAKPDLKIQIHNIQVILCYFLLYNAPMYFLIEQAIEFSKTNPHLKPDAWNKLQLIGQEIPGLETVEKIIGKETVRLQQQDDYISYQKFIESRVKDLPQQIDRDELPLITKYKKSFHTFKWHQLAGLMKLFRSQTITDIFGNAILVPIFYNELKSQWKKHEEDVKQNSTVSMMDVKLEDGKLCWLDKDNPIHVSQTVKL
jgi:hypothetical protein